MQTYHVRLESPVAKSYRCKRAADSLDIDAEKKSIHELIVQADIKTPYSVGLIVGASGSGKTTLARKMFGPDCFQTALDESKPIIDQLPTSLEYDACAAILSGVGLTSVPCWIRPVCTLSNGQKARAEAALLMTRDGFTVIDEWTSVVDRTVAKVMSHCVQKFARKNKKQIVLVSCHYDVIDWLNPDWIIDCNKGIYEDFRSHSENAKKKEQLVFDIRRVDRSTWKYFSKYHYLSSNLPGGDIRLFGLFEKTNQIGFLCYANYVPHRPGTRKIMHFNRLVIHPDYAGLGLGIMFVNNTAPIVAASGCRIMGKFSSVPVYRAMKNDPKWKLLEVMRDIGKKNIGGNMLRQSGFRQNVKAYSFEYIGQK